MDSKEEFDQLARMASFVSKTPIAIISFIDDNREWFKSITGIDTSFTEIELEKSFGVQVIAHQGDMLHIERPLEDVRTRNNPLLSSFNEIGMIAGVPIENDAGERLGALSVIAYKDKDLSYEQITALKTVARQVAVLIKLKNALKEIEIILSEYQADDSPWNFGGMVKDTDAQADHDDKECGNQPYDNLFQSADDYEYATGSERGSEKGSENYDAVEYSEKVLNKNLSHLMMLKTSLVQLCEMGELLQASDSMEDIVTIIMRYAEILCPEYSGAVYMLNESSGRYEIYTSWGDEPGSEQFFVPEHCWAIKLGRLHKSSSNGADLFCKHISLSEPVNCMCVPFVASGVVSGLLYLQRNRTAEKSDALKIADDTDTRNQFIVSKMAKLAGLSIGNIKHKETLGNYAVFDSLTELYNRRYMEETLRRELSRAFRKKEPVGLIMIDVDHFKKFNDSYGHAAGDNLLRSIGKFLMESIRREDIACRYGGEEFVLILPGCSLEHTVMRAEQIKEDIKKVRVWHRGRSLDRVNVSMGVGLSSEHGDSMEALLEAADRALYQAKTKGRDRIEIAQDLPY